jgi:SAM-dependent methyltransferase
MQLLSEEVLERSCTVANCRMNRERVLLGSNGYGRELGFNPLDFLVEKLPGQGTVAWVDLCCGRGRALIEAAKHLQADGLAGTVEIVGVDLVGLFDQPLAGLTGLSLVEASLSRWRPERTFDLVSCVHGLHYVGDKLGLIARSATWLSDGGLFVANLDLANLKFADGRAVGRRIAAELRNCGLEYDRKRRLVFCRGRRTVRWPLRYVGADDNAGPNYTGQPAVDSYYELDEEFDANQSIPST